MDNWNSAYSRIQTNSGNALLWTGDGVLLTPLQAGEVRFQVGDDAIASGAHTVAIGWTAQALEDQSYVI